MLVAGLVTGAAAAAPALAQEPAEPNAPVVAVTVAAATTTVRADVDGDGRRDTVTVRPRNNLGTSWRLSVATARGARSTVTHNTLDGLALNEQAWFGAAGIDGVAGRELVLRTGYGAHAALFRVYTWRGGRLVAATNPASRDREWVVDAAAGMGAGIRGYASRGSRYLAVTYAQNTWATKNPMFVGKRTTYRWSKGPGWVTVATSPVRFGFRSAGDHFGWHVAGLPGY